MSQLTSQSVELKANRSPATASSAEEVATLAWSIIDGVASDADHQRLADLLTHERELRRRYVQAIQLDSQLQSLFVSGVAPLGIA